jgi:zinc protease
MDKTVSETAIKSAVALRPLASPRGVPYWLVEDYSVPVVALEFACEAGSAYDPEGKEGAAEMMAGLLDEGAGALDATGFHEALDDHAIEMGFHADRDHVGGRLRCLARELDEGERLFALALNSPRFDADPVVRVREQMSAKLRHEAKDPGAMAHRAWRALAFSGHVFSRPPDGTLDSLARVDEDDVRTLSASLLTRKSLKIAVVGAISEARAGALVDRAFSGLPATAQLSAIEPPGFSGLGAQETHDLDVPQTTIRFGRPALMRDDDDFIASLIVMHVLGGGNLTSRLFREVREKRGLAYSVSAGVHAGALASHVFGGTTTKNERALESMRVIEEQIRDLAAGGLQSEEFEKGKTYLIGSYPLRFDTSTKIANQLVQIQRDGRGPTWLTDRNKLIAAVTLADAQRAARRLFGDGSLAVVMVGRPAAGG